MPSSIELLFSYARADESLRKELETHLKPLLRQGVTLWHDGLIEAGTDWRASIASQLASAHVVLLLVSADFLASDYCYGVEMKRALERHSRGEARVIPVLLRPCTWRSAPFEGLQVLPTDAKPVTKWADRDEAWTAVAEGIETAIKGVVSPAITSRPTVVHPPSSASGVRTPKYANEATRELSEEVEKARARKLALVEVGASTVEVDREILDLRRRLREGGQLRAGDALGDGRYLLLRKPGKGGFAVVWEGLDRVAHEPVAIKVLLSEHAGDAQRVERFFRGSRVMMGLQHPAIVRVMEPHGEDGGYHYFVMEVAARGDLRQAVLKKQIAPEQVLPLILQVGDALAEAHARGLIHRDVKPGNILLDVSWSPKLTDFDLVGGGEDTTGGTRTGALGTFVYAAPEMMQRPQDADARADVFGLGMTAIFALYGGDLPCNAYQQAEMGKLVDGLGCAAGAKLALKQAVDLDVEGRFADASAFCEALRGEEHTGIVKEVSHAHERSGILLAVPDSTAAGQVFGTGWDDYGEWADMSVKGVVQRFRWLPAGEFRMGSPKGEAGRFGEEGLQHRVTWTEGRWMADTPVTQALWKAVMAGNPSHFVGDTRPVEKVSWHDCQAFLVKLNGLFEGLDARLPTEAEWEYACRAGTAGAVYGDALDAIAWYRENSGGATHAVAEKAPNLWGLFDMLGNVYEWCADLYGPYTAADLVDPLQCTSGTYLVLRGGSWGGGARSVRAAHRYWSGPAARVDVLGFRLALSLGAEPKGWSRPR